MKLYEIVFSPTGGTQKVADLLTKTLGEGSAAVDLTDPTADFSDVSLTSEDVAVIAVPSYGGRVPVPAARRLGAIKAAAPGRCWCACTATGPTRTRWWSWRIPPGRRDSVWWPL